LLLQSIIPYSPPSSFRSSVEAETKERLMKDRNDMGHRNTIRGKYSEIERWEGEREISKMKGNTAVIE
jgi:hypothetical protein